MLVEQLSVFDLPFDVESSDLDHGCVYPKLDWITLIFRGTTINHVLKWLNVDDTVNEFLRSLYRVDGGLVPSFIFSYNHIRLEASQIGFFKSDPDTHMFDVVVPSIRLELSGEALDYLRSIGIEIYDYRFTQYDFGNGLVDVYNCEEVHCTRCDWAYDFVDYKPEFLDTFIDFLQSNSLPSGRVPLRSTKSALKYSLKLGAEKTIYLGSGKSSKLLRVYDKKLQYFDEDLNVWKKAPYGACDSWFRIEWQLRDQVAHSFLFSYEDGKYNTYESVLRQIFENYAFGDASQDARYRKRNPVAFWSELLPWEELSNRIIQNAKFVRVKTRAERCDNYWKGSCIRNNILHSSFFGVEYEDEILEDYLKSLHYYNDLIDPSTPRKRDQFMSDLAALKQCNPDYEVPREPNPNGLYIADDGWFHWKRVIKVVGKGR